MKYKVLSCNYEPDMAALVLEYIADGWKPLGGIALAYSPDARKYLYAQAMVKIDVEITDIDAYGRVAP